MKTTKTILMGLIAASVIAPSAFCDSKEPVNTSSSGKKGIVRVYEAIENGVVSGYKAIENGVVSGYKAIENGVVSGYKAIESNFTDTFLTPNGRSEDSIPASIKAETNGAVPGHSPAENS
jgi:hypothetical protein